MNAESKDGQIAQGFVALLTTEGYTPQIDEDGDVRFKFEGLSLVMLLDKEDPSYVRLCLPNFLKIGSDEHRTRVLAAVNEANKSVKIGKAFIVKDYCWAAVEVFIPDTPYLETHLSRFLRILQLLAKVTIEKSGSE